MSCNHMFYPGAVLLGLTWSILGCGDASGTPQFDIAGAVTYQGKPIPAGMITFEPDASKGNKGPQGYAPIQDGRYDTRNNGRGSVGGPQVVVISGSDGAAVSDDNPSGKPLFAPYTTTIDLGQEPSSHDFTVPSPTH